MKRKIDSKSPLSKYYQLKQIIIEMITSREIRENERLPTEQEFCDRFEISRATVRQALKELENEDYIYKIQGKGTFVSPKRFQQDLLQFYSFTEEMKKTGKRPSSLVLDFQVEKANQKVCNTLKLTEDNLVYKFIRLRLADDMPMMLETTYIPRALFPGLEKEALEEKPLYTVLIEDYQISFSRAEEMFRATIVNEHEAERLQYINGGPAILLERITYNQTNQVIEYTKSVARGDKFKYHVLLEKK